jgi:superfamily II DNA or RNA helicase
MNEAETRAELIDPQLTSQGWGAVEGSRVLREYHITDGKIQANGVRGARLKADYVLEYKGVKLAIIEAKSSEYPVGEGVQQAKDYAEKLSLQITYATNGKEIYQIDMLSGMEEIISQYPTPDELWNLIFEEQNLWMDKFNSIPFEDKGGTWQPRYYQEIAVNRVLEAIADNDDRILLTLATGTGKTAIAFQIAWKLYQTRWNLQGDGGRRPRILFLADRNILAGQAFNAFSAFPKDSLIRIKPQEIRKKGGVPKNGSIFFTIFQTFMSGGSTSSPTTMNEDKSVIFDEIEINDTANGFMYILQCSDGSFYTGSTYNLSKRLQQHKNGEGAEYTKLHLPVKLVYYETFTTINLAFEREKQIQKWSKKKKIALIKGDITKLKSLSKKIVPEPVEGYFGDYPADYFDFIIIDECHRGGANDEGNWRAILEYFSPAVQLGLTATPKRDVNADTYRYFGDPVYIYSLKEGINDGFLTPFKVKHIQTTIDDYVYTSDDEIVEGEVEEGKRYTEEDFNRVIEIKAREEKRVSIFMELIDQNQKTIVFCANQEHAAAVRDLINQQKTSTNPNYCVRVTANDGSVGEQYLEEFQDNEKTIPTILTTSQKLSTGVDARNIRNIVLMRSIKSMIEFKQIIGRGTRLFDGKEFFTIYDFVDAYQLFLDPAWDGEPIELVSPKPEPYQPINTGDHLIFKEDAKESPMGKQKIKIKLRDGKEREIQSMVSTSFWDAGGRPVSAEEFMHSLFGELPKLLGTEEELRTIWSSPITRKKFLQKLDEAGFSRDKLKTLQQLVDAENSDLFDVLEYVFTGDTKPIPRQMRVAQSQEDILENLTEPQKQFIQFVLDKYIQSGFEELDQSKLPILLQNKFHTIEDGLQLLGSEDTITELFIGFQKYLYK